MPFTLILSESDVKQRKEQMLGEFINISSYSHWHHKTIHLYKKGASLSLTAVIS